MADQTFAVNSGFYDAVNSDRTYSADDMNRPYKRLVSNGVFATPQGTPSTDLQVVSASNGMQIIVQAGEGIFADKWFENSAAINITVPDNTSTVPRVDSVIVQVDQRTSGRVGNIVYRTGTPSSNPAVPAINTVTNVTEYRVANIYVAAGANAINNDAITDLRGSSSCPWITALINQVDTSTLWTQWQAAYQAYYDQMTEGFNDWFADLTEDLTVETNLMVLNSTYRTTATTTSVPINIANYDKSTDILMVYINGLKAIPNTDYAVNTAGTSITLTKSLASGQTVAFVVLKTVLSSDMATTLEAVEAAQEAVQDANEAVQAANEAVADLTTDSGWINFTLESGATAFDSTTTPAVRCIGDRVYLRGAFKGITSVPTTVCTLPTAYRPAMNHQFASNAVYNGSVVPVEMEITTGGSVRLIAKNGTINSAAMVPMATNFVLD